MGKLKLPTLADEAMEPIYQISALSTDGIPAFEKNLVSEFKEFTNYLPERPIVFTKRQQEYMTKAVDSSKQCLQLFEEGKEQKIFPNLLNKIKHSLLQIL